MPNTYFRFRQFTVHQEKTAMKVCTDACLFGAWIASFVKDRKIERVLDVGAGTGLLSLMIAQVSSARIDAVEIEDGAFLQATENFDASPWAERLKAHHTDIAHYHPGEMYDLIVSNPPFYENDLLSDDEQRNIALHSSKLEFVQLLEISGRLTNESGQLAILIPYRRAKDLEEKISRSPFSASIKVNVRQTPKHQYFRCMYLLSKAPAGETDETEITIKSGDKYTEQFYSLLKDYYL
ncbi:MAG: methyltransferase [Chitinophagaceae bacterium]|nr:methyltransferase [Chitinophagaceae bacterium]